MQKRLVKGREMVVPSRGEARDAKRLMIHPTFVVKIT
jgi:hypothetical protein